MKLDPRASVAHYLQGLLMGSADIIPGVSGGTMALILGIYRRLIDSLSSLFSFVLALVRFDRADMRRHWGEAEFRFLIPLGLGIGTAIVLGATVILHLIETYPLHTQGLFFGLVAASLAIPWLRIARPGLREVAIAAVFAVLAFWLVSLPVVGAPEAGEVSLLRVFGSAAVAICAMILPGVSGAFLLKAMGLYEVTLEALRSLDVLYVLVFCLGAGVGLGLFSKVLDWLFDHHHDVTMAALVGLIAGALRALWPWIDDPEGARTPRLPEEAEPVLTVILIGLAGFLFIVALTWWGRGRLEEGDEVPATDDVPEHPQEGKGAA